MVDFIGIGAQKSGTSWIHACLFEHPEICSPVKELHFFSRERFANGQSWYEEHFASCKPGTKCGEFSTSYLYTPDTAENIAAMYPDVQIIAVLREPAARAYSQYRNAIKAGEVEESVTFASYFETEKSCFEQGLYSKQLQRYYNHFERGQVLVLIYEDTQKDPGAFMQQIYRHIGVDDTFVPPSLGAHINVARVPKDVRVDSLMHAVAEWLRRRGASKLVHFIKSSGLTDAVRAVNTKEEAVQVFDVTAYKRYFKNDVQALSKMIERDMVSEWNYEND